MGYTSTQNGLILLGRLFFALIFILSAVEKIIDFDSTVTYMISSGVTFYPDILAIIATIAELTGSVLLILGFYTRFAAAILFVFTGVVTLSIHHFWSDPPIMAQLQLINFLKNITVMGGALYVISFGAGDYSIDGWLKRKKRGL